MSAFVRGERVEVPTDTAALERRYFGGTDAVWVVSSACNTNVEGFMVHLRREGQPNQRRSVLASKLRRLKQLPPVLQ